MGVWAGVVTKDQHTHKKRGGERRCDHLPWKETKTMLADVPGPVLSVSASFAPVRHCKCGVTLSAIRRPPSPARMTSVSSPTLPPQKAEGRPLRDGLPISEFQKSEDHSLTRSFLTSTSGLLTRVTCNQVLHHFTFFTRHEL